MTVTGSQAVLVMRRYVQLNLDGKMASDEYAERPECGSRVVKGTFTAARTRGYGYPADLTSEARPDRHSSGLTAYRCWSF